jgi:ABC-2 type transport system ATP-binding protein
MASIEINRLTKRFGDIAAVDDLSFRVEEGTVTGFLGPNGAGKTTTLRLLLGLAAPTAGTATIGGRSYHQLTDPSGVVGAVLESSGFHPKRRARDHLRVIATATGRPAARVDAVLDTVGLTSAGHRRVGGYSLGMRQRLGLAVALLGDPEVLVLDEPTNGLDPEGVHWLRAFIRAFAGRGGTVLVSSHLLAEVAQTVDDIVVIAHGRLVAHAPLTELTARAVPGVQVRTPHPDRLRQALARDGVAAEQTDVDTIAILDTTAEAVGLIAAGAGVVIYELTTDRLGLEDIFLQLTSISAERTAS